MPLQVSGNEHAERKRSLENCTCV